MNWDIALVYCNENNLRKYNGKVKLTIWILKTFYHQYYRYLTTDYIQSLYISSQIHIIMDSINKACDQNHIKGKALTLNTPLMTNVSDDV